MKHTLMYTTLFALILAAICPLPVSAVSGTELMESFSLRVTVIAEGVEHQWEYDNPNHYEYEKGNYVIKGEEAQTHVEEIVDLLQINEETTEAEYADRLSAKFPTMERLEIRWMNRDSERFTWLWTK